MNVEGIPEGWELVRIGKMKQGEYYISNGGHIEKCDVNEPSFVYPIVRKSEWRMLEVGEKIQEGDEYFLNDKWIKTESAGMEVKGSSYRRRIDAEPPPKKYRPFKNAEEFKPHRDRWVRWLEGAPGAYNVDSYDDEGIWLNRDQHATWEEMLESKFDDTGEPVGVEE